MGAGTIALTKKLVPGIYVNLHKQNAFADLNVKG